MVCRKLVLLSQRINRHILSACCIIFYDAYEAVRSVGREDNACQHTLLNKYQLLQVLISVVYRKFDVFEEVRSVGREGTLPGPCVNHLAILISVN